MSRKARIDAAGALQHIIVRGIERCRIFYDDNDRSNFLKGLVSKPIQLHSVSGRSLFNGAGALHLNPLRAGLVGESAQLVMLLGGTRTWDDHRSVGRTTAFGIADRKPIRSARAKNSFSEKIETVVIIKQWTSPKNVNETAITSCFSKYLMKRGMPVPKSVTYDNK